MHQPPQSESAAKDRTFEPGNGQSTRSTLLPSGRAKLEALVDKKQFVDMVSKACSFIANDLWDYLG